MRWAGSKRKSLQALTAFWSDKFERYIEPFVGSACLFLKIKPKAAILSDLNSSLIDTYRAIQRKPRAIARGLYGRLGRDSGMLLVFLIRVQNQFAQLVLGRRVDDGAQERKTAAVAIHGVPHES